MGKFEQIKEKGRNHPSVRRGERKHHKRARNRYIRRLSIDDVPILNKYHGWVM